MKRVTIILKGCILGFFLLGMAFGQVYEADVKKGKVQFEISSIHGKVVVNFNDFEANVKFDPANLNGSSISGSVKSSSLNSGNGGRDGALKGKKYLYQEKYPNMTFSSKRIVKDGDSYKAVGTLSIKGQSREFEMPFSFDGKLFKSNFELKLKDFEISTGGFFHGDEGKVVMEFGTL